MKARQVLAGFGWTGLSTALNVLAQVAVMAVLARHLSPSDFGTMLMANIALRFVSFFSQAGASQTLIQRPDLTPALTGAALAVSVGLSLLLYLGMALAAPAVALAFQNDGLQRVLWVYGASLPLGAVAALPLALLRRRGAFRSAGVVDVVAYVGGYGITGTVCALQGAGVWSLVAATLAQQAVGVVWGWWLARPALARPQRADLRAVATQGAGYSTVGFLEFAWANVEALVIGRLLGSSQLGVFNRAQMVANLPVEQAVNAAAKVLFPAFSAAQGRPERLADAHAVVLLGCGAVAAALAGGVAAAAADVVALLLGAGWSQAATLVPWLALGVPALFLYTVCGMTLDSLAAWRAKLRLQATLLVVKGAVVAWAWPHGLLTVAQAVVALEWLRAVSGGWLVTRVLPLRAGAVRGAWGAVAATGAVVAGLVALASEGARWAGWPLAGRLAAEAGCGALAVGLCAAAAVALGGRYAPLAGLPSLKGWHDRAHRALFMRRPAAPLPPLCPPLM